MTYKTALLLAAAATILPASAQNLHQEVDVEHEIVIEHKSFNPIKQFPQIQLPASRVASLAFSNPAMSVAVTPQAAQYGPVAWGDSLIVNPYRGYVMLGYWPTYHLDLSAGYRILDTDRTRLSAWAQLNGRNYKVDNLEHRRTTAAIGVDLRQAMGRESWLDAGVVYRYNSFNPMGEAKKGTVNNPAPVVPCMSQRTNAFNANVAWHSNIAQMTYMAAAQYDYFGYRNGMYIYMPPFTAPMCDPVHENVIRLKGGARLPVAERGKLGLDVAAAIIVNSRMSTPEFTFTNIYGYDDTEWSYDTPQYVAALYHGNRSHALISLTPRYQYASDIFTADIGLRFDIGVHSGRKFLISPDVKLAVKPFGMLTISAEVTGGQHLNTLRSLFETNYLNAPMFAYKDSNVPVDTKLSVMVGPRSGIFGEVFVGYSKANDWLMPVIEQRASFFTPQDLTAFRIGAVIGASWRKIATIQGRFEMAQSDYNKAYYLWHDRAKYVAGVDLTVKPIAPLSVNLGWQLRAHRAIADVNYTILPQPLEVLTYIPLHNISDLNAGATWTINDAFTAFVNINNLLNRHPLTIGGIKMEGLNGLVGIEYKF